MPNTVSVSTLASERLVSTFDGILKPDFANVYFRRHGSQGLPYFQMLRNLGMVVGAGRNTGYQFEQNYIQPTLIVGSGGLTTIDAATGLYSFVLETTAGSNEFLQGNQAFPYQASPSVYGNPAQIQQRLAFPGVNNTYMATVYNVTGTPTNTVTVFIRITNGTLLSFSTAAVPQGTELWITGDAWAPGTRQPTGRVLKPLLDQWYMQILKSNMDIDGELATDNLWVEKFSNGDSAETWTMIGMGERDYLHARKLDAALLFEKPSTNMNAQPLLTSEPEQTTEGLRSYIIRQGGKFNVPVGGFTISTFNDLEKYFDQQMPGANYYCMANGISIDQNKDAVLKGYLNFNMQDYAVKAAEDELFGGNPGNAAAVGFRYFKSGYTVFCQSRLPQLNDPKGAGLPGYGYQNESYIFPIGKKKDADTQEDLPFFGMKYKSKGGYSRLAEVVNIMGATNGQHQTDLDVNAMGLKTEMGATHCAGNAMAILAPNASAL